MQLVPAPSCTRISHCGFRSARCARFTSKGQLAPPRHPLVVDENVYLVRISIGTPERPIAARIRPQLGSEPAQAVFTSGECAYCPCDLERIGRSPSLFNRKFNDVLTPRHGDISFASDWQTSKRARPNGSRAPPRPTPLSPLATSATVSFVDVSPSTEIRLKVSSATSRSRLLSSFGEALKSVKR